jgi:hypothetical protein
MAKTKIFSLKSGIRKGWLLSPYLFNIVLEFLARVTRQGREISKIHIRKEEVKLFLFVYGVIIERP